MDDQRILGIYTALASMEVSLDRDPLVYGPKRLNYKTAEIRHFLTRTERIFLSISQEMAQLKRRLRIGEADFKIAEQDLLANDPVVRSGRSVKDREALAAMKLQEETATITELQSSVNDLEAALTVVKAKRTDLKDVQRALRDQMKLCQEEINLGSHWGSKASPGSNNPIDPNLVGVSGEGLQDIADLIGDVEGEIHLAKEAGEWEDPEEFDDDTSQPDEEEVAEGGLASLDSETVEEDVPTQESPADSEGGDLDDVLSEVLGEQTPSASPTAPDPVVTPAHVVASEEGSAPVADALSLTHQRTPEEALPSSATPDDVADFLDNVVLPDAPPDKVGVHPIDQELDLDELIRRFR